MAKSTFAYRLRTDDDRFIMKEIMHDDMYCLKDYAGWSGIAIDCGAHIGVFSVALIQAGFGGKILAYEPNRQNFQYLAKNCQQFSQVEVYNTAVGLKTEEIYACCEFPASQTGRWKVCEQGDIMHKRDSKTHYDRWPCVDLAAVILAQEKVDILKLDLEGHEALLVNEMSMPALSKPKVIILEEHGQPINYSRLLSCGFELVRHSYGMSRHSIYRKIKCI